MPHLLRLLADSARLDSAWRFAPAEVSDDVARALLWLGPEVLPLLLAAAENVKLPTRVRAGCGVALAQHLEGKDKRVLKAVRWALANSKGELRSLLCSGLTRIAWDQNETKWNVTACTGAEACLPELWEALGDSDPRASESAGLVLGILGETNSALKPILLQAIKAKKTRNGAMAALRRFGPKDPAVIRAAAVQLKVAPDDYWGVQAILYFLQSAGPEAKAAIPAILDCIEKKENMTAPSDSDSWPIAWHALEVLKAMGPTAKPAEKRLKKLHEDKGIPPKLRERIGWCLQTIDPKNAPPAPPRPKFEKEER